VDLDVDVGRSARCRQRRTPSARVGHVAIAIIDSSAAGPDVDQIDRVTSRRKRYQKRGSMATSTATVSPLSMETCGAINIDCWTPSLKPAIGLPSANSLTV
jgi:hypothetical protein